MKKWTESNKIEKEILIDLFNRQEKRNWIEWRDKNKIRVARNMVSRGLLRYFNIREHGFELTELGEMKANELISGNYEKEEETRELELELLKEVARSEHGQVCLQIHIQSSGRDVNKLRVANNLVTIGLFRRIGLYDFELTDKGESVALKHVAKNRKDKIS